MSSSPAPSRTQRRAFWLLLVLLALGIPSLAFEVWLRLGFPNVDLMEATGRTVRMNPMAEWAVVDAFSAYRAKSGRSEVRGEIGPVEKTVNRHGFISTPEIEPEKGPETIRLVFLGGSSTAGTGHDLGDRQTWPWQVVESLAQQNPDHEFDFINAALGGYTSFESYGRLWSRLRFFRPDLVVVYHGWNEMYYFQRFDRIHEWRVKADGSWHFQRLRLATHRPWPLDILMQHSQLACRLRLLLGRLDVGPGERSELVTRTEGYDPRALGVWRQNLQLIRQASEWMGAELFVAKQATLIVPGLAEEHRARCRVEYHGFGFDDHVEAFDGIYRVIDEEIEPPRVLDVTEISGRPEYFADHVHPTVEGAEAIAQLVTRQLQAYIDSPKD